MSKPERLSASLVLMLTAGTLALTFDTRVAAVVFCFSTSVVILGALLNEAGKRGYL